MPPFAGKAKHESRRDSSDSRGNRRNRVTAPLFTEKLMCLRRFFFFFFTVRRWKIDAYFLRLNSLPRDISQTAVVRRNPRRARTSSFTNQGRMSGCTNVIPCNTHHLRSFCTSHPISKLPCSRFIAPGSLSRFIAPRVLDTRQAIIKTLRVMFEDVIAVESDPTRTSGMRGRRCRGRKSRAVVRHSKKIDALSLGGRCVVGVSG